MNLAVIILSCCHYHVILSPRCHPAFYPYLNVLVLVLQEGQGQEEAAHDEEEQQAEEEQDQGHHSQHVDQGLLHLQALLPN